MVGGLAESGRTEAALTVVQRVATVAAGASTVSAVIGLAVRIHYSADSVVRVPEGRASQTSL